MGAAPADAVSAPAAAGSAGPLPRRAAAVLGTVGPAVVVGLLAWPRMGDGPAEVWFLLAQTLPLLVRRRWPAPVLAVCVTVAACEVLAGLGLTNAVAGQGVATATVVARRRWPRSVLPPLAAMAVGTGALLVAGGAARDRSVAVLGTVLLLGWAIGNARARRAAVRAAAEHELRTRRETGELRARVAAVQERLRIERELHELVAGGLDAIVVTAGAARLCTRSAAVEQVVVIERVGRALLAELDRFLHLLRRGAPALGEPDGSARDGPAPCPLPLPVAVDAVLAGTIAALALTGAAWLPPEQRPSTGWLVALVAAGTVPLLVRGRWPEAVTVAVTAALAVQLLIGMPIGDGLLAVAVAVHGVAARRTLKRAIGLAVVAAGVLAVLIARLDLVLAATLMAALAVFVAGALAIGEGDRRAAADDADLRRRLAAAEDDDRLRLRAAVVDQRARAARDLHDSIGHTVSLIVLLAGAARLGSDFATSLAGVERAARTALAELDERVEATPDTGPDPADPVPADPVPADPVPQCLQDLAEDVRAAGVPVTLHIADVDDLPAGVARVVYLLVREALTNVMKHAPGAPTVVRVERPGNVVRVRVTNTAGPGGLVPLPSGSRGLAGMRERVALFGGRLDAGPDSHGGFALDAAIPLPTDVAPPSVAQGAS